MILIDFVPLFISFIFFIDKKEKLKNKMVRINDKH